MDMWLKKLTEQAPTAGADPLYAVTEELQTRTRANLTRLRSQTEHLVRTKETARLHIARWKGMDPAMFVFGQRDALPKAWWMSSVAVLLVQTLEQISLLDHEVRRHYEELSLLGSDLSLQEQLESLDVAGLFPSAAKEESAQVKLTLVEGLVDKLAQQELTELTKSVVTHLRAVVRDTDPAVAEQREAIREALVSFIDQQINMVITDAGYHHVQARSDLQPGSMLDSAKHQVLRIGALLGEPSLKFGIRQGDYARALLDLECALSLLLLSFRQFSAMWAKHVCSSVIDGRIDFIELCLSALEPAKPVDADQFDQVEYRMKAAYDRTKRKLDDYKKLLRRDREALGGGLGQATRAVAEAVRLKLRLKQVRSLPA